MSARHGFAPILAPLLLAFGSVRAAPPERTLTLDVIDLVRGVETPGRAELAVEHEGIAYHFARGEHRAAFEAARERYAVADGGACGRMGPLSGLGDARRLAVHEGRVYFFASDACREGFLANPARCIEQDDPRPEPSDAEATAGADVLDSVVAWAGGEDLLRSITSYRQIERREEEAQGRTWRVKRTLAAGFPDRFMTRETWNDLAYSTVRGPEGAVMASGGEQETIAASRARAFDRALARELVVLLKAHVDGEGDDRPVVAADGPGMVADAEVDFVRLWHHGAASRLAVERVTGRPVQLAFRGRDRTSSVGEVVRTYADHAVVAGVRLPTGYVVTFDGEPLEAAGASYAFEVNVPVTADLFFTRR